MAITSRLGLHKPDNTGEPFGDYFPGAYGADLQQIDDSVQIKDVTAAGNIPVYGVDGLLADSGIAPADLEAGLISSILTTQGMLLYKAADALAALSADTAGKSLLTQGAGANPVFGYPSHSTLTNLEIGDPHTQYVLRSLLSARGDLVYRGASDWQRLAKGVSGRVLMQGASDPYWGTRYFEIDFPFGNGSDVIENYETRECSVPINCKIIRMDLWEVGLNAGSAQSAVYIHDLGADKGGVVLNLEIAAGNTYNTATGLSTPVSANKIIRADAGITTTAKHLVLRLVCEAT